MMVSIELSSPEKMLDNERNSKLLLMESKLAKHLTLVRSALKKAFPTEMDCRPLHVDLSLNLPTREKDTKTLEITRRAKALHGLQVDLKDEKNWGFTGVGQRAFVLWLPALDQNSPHNFRPHITVGYFRVGSKLILPEHFQDKIRQLKNLSS